MAPMTQTDQETDMKDKIDNTQNQDLIDLGVASVETKGPSGITEGLGFGASPGISDA